MDLNALIAYLNHRLRGYSWLLRDDDTEGFFAHVYKKQTPFEPYVPEVNSFKTFAVTPEEALERSIDRAIAKRRDLS